MASIKVVVVLKLSNIKGTRLAVFATHIETSLTGNTNFTSVYPGLGVLTAAITVLNDAIRNQVKGLPATTAAVKQAEYKLRRVLKILAAYVEWISDDNATIALSSGFSIREHTAQTTPDFSVIHGLLMGEVNVRSKAFRDGSYIFQYSQTPLIAASWITAATKKQAKHTITGLTPGVMYWFRVIVVTKAGEQPASNAVNLMVV